MQGEKLEIVKASMKQAFWTRTSASMEMILCRLPTSMKLSSHDPLPVAYNTPTL